MSLAGNRALKSSSSSFHDASSPGDLAIREPFSICKRLKALFRHLSCVLLGGRHSHGRLMGLLLSCWFIVGTILIPNGFARWNQMSYFVHPVVLVFCELYLISKYLVGQVVFVLVYPFRVVFRAILFVFRLLRSRTNGLISLVVDVVEVSDDDESPEEDQYFEAAGAEDPARSVVVPGRWGGARAGVGSSPSSVLHYYQRFFPGVSIDVPDESKYPGHGFADEEDLERPQKGKRKRRDSSFAESDSGAFLLEMETEMSAAEEYNAEPSDVFERWSDDGEDTEDAASLAAYHMMSTRGRLAAEDSGRFDFTFPHVRSSGSSRFPKGLDGVLERERDEDQVRWAPPVPVWRPEDEKGDEDHVLRVPPATLRRLEAGVGVEDHVPWGPPATLRRLEAKVGDEYHVPWAPPASLRRLEGERRFHPEEDGDGEELEASEEESAPEDPPLAESLPGATPREKDVFHEEYEKRMKWFDRVNYERTGEASKILNIQPGNPSLLGNIDETIRAFRGTSIQCLIKGIEDGLEMVYVSQMCLSWEALDYQYFRAVDTLNAAAVSSSGAGEGVPYAHTTKKFELFQDLLERYVESESKEIRRVWNYSQSRFSASKLLQVPEISGDERRPDGTPAAREVRAAVEKAIHAFWSFLMSDDHRPPGILKKLLWVDPQVEDPRDLNLLDKLKKTHRKKEKQLKKLPAARGRWWQPSSAAAGSRSAAPPLEPQSTATLYAMTDLKLVGRVLGMSVISTQELDWCRQKLEQVVIRRGKVVRAPPGRFHFPCS